MVLEEAAEDRAHADVLREARHARPQRAGAAHDQVDLHAGLRRRVQRADHVLLDQRVHLRDDARRLAFARVRASRRISSSTRPCIVNGASSRCFSRAAFARLVMCRNTSLTSAQIVRVGGEQPEVGVEPRRARMVVAGAQMRVRTQPRPALGVALAAQQQRELGVRLEAEHAVDDLRARAARASRPS